MKLNITPIYKNSFSCFENMLATIMSYYNLDYDLIFSRSWGFSYTKKPLGKNISLSDRLSSNKGDVRSCLEKFYGIKAEYSENMSSFDLLSYIKNQLDAGKPVPIFIRCFWLPWNEEEFQKDRINNHGPHAIIVTGYEDINKGLLCADTDPMITNAFLPIELFHSGCTGYMTFELSDRKYPIDWKEIIYDAVLHLKGNSNDSFECMRLFSDEIIHEDIKNEVGSDLWRSELVRKLTYISWGRRNFKLTLEYLANMFNNIELLTVAKKMEEAGLFWTAIRGMIVKSCIISNPQLLLKRVSDKIKVAALNEENIANELLELCCQENYRSNIHREENKLFNLDENKANNVRVNISRYCNNQAFGFASENKTDVDLCGRNTFFSMENFAMVKINIERSFKFDLSNITGKQNDNISCEGQEIILPENYYNSIAILSCSDHGNFSEELVINYEDQHKEKVEFKISEVNAMQPYYGEYVAWEDYCYMKTDKGNICTDNVAHLYIQECKLDNRKKLKSIFVPYCPNIHIFGITLNAVIK